MCKALQPLKEERVVTWEELSSHNKASDLWVAVNGRAYDLTAYQTAHPGGALILQHHAGRDASEAWIAYAHNTVPGMRQLMRVHQIGVMKTPTEAPLSKAALKLRRVREEMERDGLFVPNLWHYAQLAVALAAAFTACIWLVHARCWLSGGLLMSLFWQQARHSCSCTDTLDSCAPSLWLRVLHRLRASFLCSVMLGAARASQSPGREGTAHTVTSSSTELPQLACALTALGVRSWPSSGMTWGTTRSSTGAAWTRL